MPNSPVPESSGRPRHLYLVEILLGAAFLALVAFFMWSANSPREQAGSSHSDKVVTLTAANWEKEVLRSKVPVLVDFWGKH